MIPRLYKFLFTTIPGVSVIISSSFLVMIACYLFPQKADAIVLCYILIPILFHGLICSLSALGFWVSPVSPEKSK